MNESDTVHNYVFLKNFFRNASNRASNIRKTSWAPSIYLSIHPFLPIHLGSQSKDFSYHISCRYIEICLKNSKEIHNYIHTSNFFINREEGVVIQRSVHAVQTCVV